VSAIKESIEELEGFPIAQQRLIFDGKQLEDEKTLEDCGLQDFSTLHLAIQHVQQGPSQIYVKLLIRQNYNIYKFSRLDTVLGTKSRIEELEGVPIARQRLICDGKQLEDEKTLGDCGMQDFSTLHLVVQQGLREVYVKMVLSGKIFTIDKFSPSDTVFAIKTRIEELEGVPIALTGPHFCCRKVPRG
jgi:ubiquitin C